MKIPWKRITILLIYFPLIVLSISINSVYVNLIHKHINDFISFDKFYKSLLKNVQQHRLIDTVYSPIDIRKLVLRNYDEYYLKTFCYQNASDLFHAHGYNTTNLKLDQNQLESLFPALLNVIENPGCQRKPSQLNKHSFFDVWILGIVLILVMKFLHLIIFFISGNNSTVLTSDGISKTISSQTNEARKSIDRVYIATLKYHLWLGLSFNSFTCGIIIGTTIYHIIPHIYRIPYEDVDYTYLFRATVVFVGVLLFFVVEKLLRFRFHIDEIEFNETTNSTDERITSPDASIIQMANMHGTVHVHERDHSHYLHSESSIRLNSNTDSIDDEAFFDAAQRPVTNIKRNSNHHTNENSESSLCKLLLYHMINDFSNNIIYGCSLSTAFAHDRLTGFIFWLTIFIEGFRRHAQLLTTLGRKYNCPILFLSIICFIIGYVIGGFLSKIDLRMNTNGIYIYREYIYSIIYGTFFFTALVTLIPELHDFGQHIQIITRTENQSIREKRFMQFLILSCQNIFLICGVLVTLILSFLWRYYYRRDIRHYLCSRDFSLPFCHSSI